MFSVVIPCFNRLPQLARVLAGFCAQSGSESFEIILVDNNGFDGDINALYCRYVDRFPLTLLRQPRLPHPRAMCRARNQGLSLARHEWIINIDSDCIPPPEYLGRIRKAIGQQAHYNPLIVGLRQFICGDEISEEELRHGRCDLASLPRVASPSNYGRALDRRYPEIEAIAGSPHPWAYMHSGNLIYRREEALKIGGYDEAFDGFWGYEDIDFAHRLITRTGARPFYLAGIECYHQDSRIAGATTPVNNEERFNKAGNPNWVRICERIPGFEQFKLDQYRQLNAEIKL
jgi:glycosyltransferase involved in cell wall biosynthesis